MKVNQVKQSFLTVTSLLLLTTACTNSAVRSAPAKVANPTVLINSESPQAAPVQRSTNLADVRSKAPANTMTLSNREWTVTISNLNSWSGVNNTGNLSYHGCKAKGDCLRLTGGTVVAREGILSFRWRNGDYSYVIDSPITDSQTSPTTSSDLFVYKGGRLILRATGLR